MPQPPPYNPNWQLQQTQFYNSATATGQYPQGQPQNTGDRQKFKQSQQASHVCELCRNKGHCDYQCQFASNFMNRTQKAFQCSHYMHDNCAEPEWLQNDDQPNHEQPFQ